MTLDGLPLLSIIIFLPLVGGVLLLLVPSRQEKALKTLALVFSLATFLISLPLFFNWQMGEAGMQFVEQRPWIPQFNVSYHVGVDGISLFLVLLTSFLAPLTLLFSWDSIKDQLKTYLVLMLLLETAMLGVFAALDLILFYVFWELTLVPMYFLIGRWGGPRRVYAAIKFFIYTMSGSVLMLVAILVLYFYAHTFDFLELYEKGVPPNIQLWAFLAFGLAFAIKVPIFPFHTWLPDAHVEAPTAGSVILAGILLKMGTYGFLRFCLPLFPDTTRVFIPYLSSLGVVGILYAALVALRQRDVKSLVAYSSVAHLGFVILGIFSLRAQGVSGAILQMVNHGLSTGALFLLVGMIYERRHTRMLDDFGGLWAQVPIYSGFLVITVLSSAGLPGLNGFVGEFTILLGTFKAHRVFAVLGTAGIILAAWYLLHAVREMLQGPLTRPENRQISDVNLREVAIMVPIVVMFIIIGLFPNLFFARMNPSVTALLERYEQPITALVVER
ncbi:MAG TPA: NADH-quinone oxidoreductase subunit M [Anaerolineae bacterium]|nr:NADH-quinone oxidoreductase subunit M [Anaerolineae bacterium]HIQ05681.1 NADH-quinone oxidoreductase subunit M [Anaerolineae bacterium]